MEDVRRQRVWLMVALAVVAAAVVAAAIAIGGAGGDETGSTTDAPQGAAESRVLFDGIPQRREVLGKPGADVTVTEFADLQCPFCAESARDELPEVVRRYVRTGRVKLVFRGLAFIGPDSVRATRMAAAAALQNRLWQFVHLVYRNQGQENSGWVTDAYLRRVARAAGVDVKKAFAVRDTAEADLFLSEARLAAKTAKVESTPTFVIARGGRDHEVKRVTGPGELAGALDEVLAGR